MTLTFTQTNTYTAKKEVAVSPTTGFTYEVHNKWLSPRGQGYAVFVRDCATGKSVTGNTAAFYSQSLNANSAKQFCLSHDAAMNAA